MSGDDVSIPVTEFIIIDKTDREMTLLVKAFADGTGKVSYSWDGIEDCVGPSSCIPCQNYKKCNSKFSLLKHENKVYLYFKE